MRPQIDRANPIPDTFVFDGHLSRKGYRLNKFCHSLTSAAARAEFRADETAYMTRLGLPPEEQALVKARDFYGLIAAGTNIYMMLKLGSATGNGLYQMGAQQRGQSYEEFLKTRNVSGAV